MGDAEHPVRKYGMVFNSPVQTCSNCLSLLIPVFPYQSLYIHTQVSM